MNILVFEDAEATYKNMIRIIMKAFPEANFKIYKSWQDYVSGNPEFESNSIPFEGDIDYVFLDHKLGLDSNYFGNRIRIELDNDEHTRKSFYLGLSSIPEDQTYVDLYIGKFRDDKIEDRAVESYADFLLDDISEAREKAEKIQVR